VPSPLAKPGLPVGGRPSHTCSGSISPSLAVAPIVRR
jgi:hypothetical protein